MFNLKEPKVTKKRKRHRLPKQEMPPKQERPPKQESQKSLPSFNVCNRILNMNDSQPISFKIWMLNYLEQKLIPVDFSELSNDFDKVTNSVHGLDNLDQRLNVSSFTDLLEKDYDNLLELDENGKFIILESGKNILAHLLNNCQKCSNSTLGSGEGFCLSHAIDNLRTWTTGCLSVYESSSNGINKEQSNDSRSPSYDENQSILSSSKDEYKTQCHAFKIWFFNHLSINEGLNIGQIGDKFSKEIKKVNWNKQFGYPKLSTFIEQEMKGLVSIQGDKYKITDLGKQMLTIWLNNCDVCKPSASSFYGYCAKHALNILWQFTELRNDTVLVASTIKQKENNLCAPSSAFSTFDSTTVSLIVSFKVWLLDLLKKDPRPISFTNVKTQLESLHGKKIDSMLMFNVKDISELMYSQSILGPDYIVIEKDTLQQTSKGKSHMMFLINNCFFCKKGTLQGVCYSHAVASLKNWTSEKVSQDFSHTLTSDFCFSDVEGNKSHQNSLKVIENLNISYSNVLSTTTVSLSQNDNEKVQSCFTPLMKSNSSSLHDVSFKNPSLFQKASSNNLPEFPTLAESKNRSFRYPVLNQRSSVPVNNRSISELQEFEILEIPNISKATQYFSREHINSTTIDCIQQLAESNEHVSLPKIVSCLLNRFQVRSLNMLNNYIKKPEDIDCIFKHSRNLCKINGYIQAFVTVRSVATVHELYECLKEYDYDNLQLGPFIRLPILYDYFKIPNDLKVIPQIETKDIILNFRNYLTENQKWTEKVDLPEFLNYLTKQFNAINWYYLGIQIRSLPLMLQVVKKSQRDEKNRRIRLNEELDTLLNTEMTGYIDSFYRHLIKCSDNLNRTKQYLFTKPLNQVLNNFLETYEQMINGLLDDRRKKNYKSQIKTFRSALKSDSLLTGLFSLAICCSFDGSVKEILEKINIFYQESIDIPNKKRNPEENTKKLPSESEVITLIKDYLERILEKGQLTLKHLSQIETKLSEKFGIPFDNLGCGTFLECLVQQPTLLQMLDEAGCSSLGLSSSGGDSKHHYLPSFPEVLSFLHQCDNSLSQDMLAAALCQYYGVSDVKALNYGSLNRLLKSDNQSRQIYNIIYETAITISGSTPLLNKKTVGYLGSKSVEEAINCLENCPLLEDLINWSHWELVFKPELGDIKNFIKKYGNGWRHGGIRRQPLLTLEVQPGKLLKLTNDATDESFSNAACAGDIKNTCGHLVSLIALNGVQNSLALWSTRIKLALSNIYEKEAERDDPDKNPDLVVCRFVLGCLMLIPRKICHALAAKVFLEPLSSFGDSQSKQLLLQCCSNSEEVGLLQELGMVLVIQEWAESFNDRIKFKKTSISSLPSEFKNSSQEESSDEGSEELFVCEYEASGSDDESILDSLSDNNDNTLLALNEDFSKIPDNSSESGDVVESSKENEKIELNDNCLLVIETIRKEEFGIGLELDGPAAALLRCHEERLGRSLDRLSKDLYSKDTHFVLELIQNADDNTYPPEYFEKDIKIDPAIKFVLQSDKILILNNECGFLEKHIRALCDVGKSTKGKHEAGYIGQKGIGFKSVFRISNQPEIHSAGFHFCFDVSSGPMGYIMPHWVEDADPQESWTTKILLPLKDEFQTTMNQRCLLAQFEDIHSSLLIFLHRLRSISIVNEVENKYIEMKRKDLSPNLMELSCSDSKCQWLVIRKKLDASKISTQMKGNGGVDIIGTELALAFPLITGNEKKTSLKAMPPKQKVFAFLPLRSYGFRFILQADFEVPSSREDIDTDSPWNQWLRNEVHVLFCEALQHFKDLASLNSVEAVCYFLQFVPFEDEILDFFRPVTSGIHKLLCAKPCIPVISDEKSVDWKIPIQVVIPDDSFTQEVIPPSLIKQTLDLYYIHPQVVKNVSTTLLTSLGVQKLDTSHLISIGLTLAADLRKNKDNSDAIRNIFNWLICLFRSLGDIYHDNILDPIKSIPIIPLANGQLVTISDNSIFFPVKRKKLGPDQKIISLIEKELKIVHPDLVTCTDDIQRSQVVKLLEIIGVKHTVPKEIISGHIIPAFQSDSWNDKCQETLVAYVVYIKQQLDQISPMINLDELKSIIQILTNHGLKNPLQESIHFTKNYANPVDLPKQLEGFQWTLLDSCYLNFSSSFDDKPKDNVIEWRNFFSKLGVLDSLDVKPCSITHTSKTLKSSIWSNICNQWPVSEKYIIKDFVCDQFLTLTSKNECPSSQHNQMTTLVELIDRDWNNHFVKMITAEVCNEDGHVICRTESSFSLSLKHLPWLPGEQCITKLLDDETVIEVNKKDFWLASELFKSCDEFKKFLSIHVPYLMASLSSHSSFAQHLGLKEFVNLDLIKKLLISWCTRKDDTVVSFITSLSHMCDIYKYLWRCSNPLDLEEIFVNHPIIFVPNSQTCDSKSLVCGKFLTNTEVFWSEPSGVLAKYYKHFQIINLRRNLSFYYPELERIFLESTLVSPHPNIDEYIAVLECMSDISVQVQTIIPEVLKLYMVIYKFIILNSEALPDIKASLYGHQIFPTTSALWVGLEDKPMIADDRELVELFQKEKGVYLLDFTQTKDKKSHYAQDSDQEAVLAFFKACGIEKLSECVTSVSETQFYQPCPSMQKFVHEITPYIQIFLWNKLPDIYNELKLQNITQQLKQLRFAQASQLYLKYTLKQIPSIVVTQNVKCSLVEGQLIIQENFKENYHIMYNQLVSFFIRGHPDCTTQLRLFLSGLVPVIHGQSKESISEFKESQKFEVLPSDEEIWSIPLPEMLSIIYPVLPPQPKIITKPEFTSERVMTCFPPQAPKQGSSQNKNEENLESSQWPRVPTPPPELIHIRESLSSNKTENPANKEYNENLHSTHNTHRDSESQNSSLPSSRNSDISDQDSAPHNNLPAMRNSTSSDQDTESPNTCKRKKQMDSDVVEINDNEGQSFKRQMHSEEGKKSTSVGKRLTRSSSLPNRKENFPHHDDSIINVTDRKENIYSKIYHPRPKSRDHPTNEIEVEFEELGIGKNLVVPKMFESTQLEDRIAIGRYGEALVYDFLHASQFYPRSEIKICKIDWMNENGESEYPFDLRVSLENAMKIFIEVKTTKSDVKEVFEISLQEIRFAEEKKDAYHLFRVYNAGNNDKKRLVFLPDLASKLENHSIKLCMVI